MLHAIDGKTCRTQAGARDILRADWTPRRCERYAALQGRLLKAAWKVRGRRAPCKVMRMQA